MTELDSDDGVRPVRTDTEKIADEDRDTVVPAVDPDREAARKIFDDIKAARERAAKRRG